MRFAAVGASSMFFYMASLSPVVAGSAELAASQVQAGLAAGEFTAESLTRTYLARLHRLNPRLHAVIAVNPRALDEARAADTRRRAGQVLGPLDGIPVLLKDNIDVAGGMATTAGSWALAQNQPQADAALVTRLRSGGVVILGKSNLSEWANIRSTHSSSGWSATGGMTHNPYALDRTACGSSSGSAAGVAANLAVVAVGTETDGSITCPAAMTGLVGLKPTVGLVSRSGIVPISNTQDTAGPMARTVRDAATLLDLLAGSDPADPATQSADSHRLEYGAGLRSDALRGVRIGVLRFLNGFGPRTRESFDAALATLRSQGATLVEIDSFDMSELGTLELEVLLTEFKVGIDAYLAATPPAVRTRSLKDLIEFNRADPRELVWFDQDLFERAAATGGLDDPAYLAAWHAVRQRAGPGIDRLLRENGVVALVAPTADPAWVIDRTNGDRGGASAGKLAAIAGYPHLTVPMGLVDGLPVGLSFLGTAWSEPLLLSLGYSFEQARQARRAPSSPFNRLSGSP